MAKTVVVIWSGFGGLAAAIQLARQGFSVKILEKNEAVGGRASVREKDGFRWDMGPSWYLMPDVFADFRAKTGEKIEDWLTLTKLDPSYKIFFNGENRVVDVRADLEKNRENFEAMEPGAMAVMEKYLEKSKYQYEVAMKDFVRKNYDSVREFFNWKMLVEGAKLHVFSSMKKYAEKFFKSPAMQKIVQYPLVFLGTAPRDAPALYNIMTHVDFGMGVRYPQGGIGAVIAALKKIAEKNGVEIHCGREVTDILVEKGKVFAVRTVDGRERSCDAVVSNADYHRTEQKLLEKKWRSFSEKYRNSRKMAPGAFIVYLGLRKKLRNLEHHTLIFSEDWDKNFGEIFEQKIPPSDPSLYVCCPSKTDSTVAPLGKENLFFLVPWPAGIEQTAEQLEKYKKKIYALVEEKIGEKFVDAIEVERVFWNADFAERYRSFQGSALGLAHTLWQTAIFRPKNRSKKVKNLFFAGGYTNPGIGMPMCLISGDLVATRIAKFFGRKK